MPIGLDFLESPVPDSILEYDFGWFFANFRQMKWLKQKDQRKPRTQISFNFQWFISQIQLQTKWPFCNLHLTVSIIIMCDWTKRRIVNQTYIQRVFFLLDNKYNLSCCFLSCFWSFCWRHWLYSILFPIFAYCWTNCYWKLKWFEDIRTH